MAWLFEQSTGDMYGDNGRVIGAGFSGNGAGRNNPAMQAVKNVGPLPCGFYTITQLIDPDHELGPYVLVLVPDATNQMFGRSAFRIHGAEIADPTKGSDGCICIARPIRMEIWESLDRRLEVVATLPAINIASDPELLT